jgi:hypothetical protein
VTSLLDEKDGATTMIVTVLSQSKEIRNAVLASGDGARRGGDL